MAEFTLSGTKFHWLEKSGSGLKRSLNIYRVGVAKDLHDYDIAPNPHDNPFYNKNQGKFYDQAANAIAKKVVDDNKWPAKVVVTISGVAHTFTA